MKIALKIILWDSKFGGLMLRNLVDAKWNSLLKRFPKHLLLLMRNLISILWISELLSLMHPLTLDISRLIEYHFAFKYIQKSKKELILDVGSGISCFPSLLARLGFHVVISDIDKQSVKLQKKCVKESLPLDCLDRLSYVIADACAMPYRPMSFSSITCISTIEHIKNDFKAIKEIYRVLKRNGVCILSFPYSGVTKRVITSPYFMRFYTMNDIKTRFLRPTKFKIVKQHLFGLKGLLRLCSLIPDHFHLLKNLIIGLFLHKCEDAFLKCNEDAGSSVIVLKREKPFVPGVSIMMAK